MTDLQSRRYQVVRDHMRFTGTHLGPLRRGDRIIAPTGKSFRVRMMASFEFKPGTDKIVCERPYIDTGAIDRALGNS